MGEASFGVPKLPHWAVGCRNAYQQHFRRPNSLNLRQRRGRGSQQHSCSQQVGSQQTGAGSQQTGAGSQQTGAGSQQTGAGSQQVGWQQTG